MSANHAPHLSQLIRVATPNLSETEKASLREKFIAASTALVTEAKCLLDDKEELWEEKVMWMCRWEQRTGEVFPLVERRRALGIDTKIDAADGPVVAEADKAYERWVSKEIVRGRVDKDVRMEEEASQVVKEQGASLMVPMVTEKMSHVEVVSWPVRKRSWQTIAESEDEDEPKIVVLPSAILHKVPCTCCMVKNTTCIGPVGHTCNGCMQMKQGCEKSMKAVGKKAQAGASITWSSKAAKAGPSKRATDDNDDDDEVEVVKSHTHAKGKALAAESQAAYLRLQVHIDQLAKALEKIGVE
ncbi:hypothetical protein M404DRAFT_22750 [Pisolithus tinctorius Marx 270]|uniref:Uncharacterized protein n=1 Tax=Pisolithus tinctorius Marx 270 TaxID=870435 RepID=A0A0C3JIL1_PISTI|nr:hypothetical protein M404DRAFT_22750 [Pisolithus tinctorius Marx 270]